jgi:hypothetical protein
MFGFCGILEPWLVGLYGNRGSNCMNTEADDFQFCAGDCLHGEVE